MSGKTYNFQKLTPIKNADLKIYDDALNFIFNDDDIKNVAITGAYSSGKSSIIETYKSNHTNIKFLNISLAHFESIDNSSSSEYSEKTLEGKIINQLIHKINPDKIPQTNFKIKQKISGKEIAKNTIAIIAVLILLLYIILFNKWVEFIKAAPQLWIRNVFDFTTNSGTLLLSGILCVGCLSLILYRVIEVQRNRNIFKKVKLQGNEIEIFEQQDESYFDKYLNEVLYIFENSNADAIVFEDMDRYNINQIFEKLREINILVNSRGKKPIRFLYLLRDDIFVSKDRTKFFDFIIPVVPVIDASNSYDQFIVHFKQGGIFELFTNDFLQGLSLYVDDMRMLKNIYNEFIIYNNRIQSIELNNDKLLAIITYKNIFPRDFSDLQLGMGFVHTIFESKSEFIHKLIHDIDNKINILERNIKMILEEELNSVDELDAIYLKTVNYSLQVNGIHQSGFETRAKFIRAMKDNPNGVRYYNSSWGRNEQVDIGEALQELLNNKEYVQRKNAIERKGSKQVENLKEEIENLQEQKMIVQNSRLREIINKDNIDIIFGVTFTNEIGKESKFEEIKSSPYFSLIKYLIRNGYIDETYSDYMTYFYENSLSRTDKIFLRSITDEIPKEFSYSLKNPQLVLLRLRDIDFDNVEILNFDLLSYLLKTRHTNLKYLNRFINQLISTNNTNFIINFFNTRQEINLFIEILNHKWPSICKYLLSDDKLSYKDKWQYVIDTLYFSSDVDIQSLNDGNCLEEFISDKANFLDIYNPNISKIINGFTILNVEFASIDYSTANHELFYEVYKKNQYRLTFKLITLMLEIIYKVPRSKDFNTKNYTLVSSKSDEPLLLYINNNINKYVNIIFENCGNCINDDEVVAIEILNNSELETTNKEKYINFLQTIIQNITNIDDKELWSLLLLRKLIRYSEDNILNYFFLSENELDNSLIQFINFNNQGLSFDYDLINENFGQEAASKFLESIVTSNELSNIKYEEAINSLKRKYNEFPYKEIDADKIDILIKRNIIGMTEENILMMRENYPDQVVDFIIENIDIYANKVISDENFSLHEILAILEENIDEEYKICLLKYVKSEISVRDKRYSEVVKMYILENNLDIRDTPFLIRSYSSASNKMKKLIIRISIENVDEIIENEVEIPFELLSELFIIDQLTIEKKKKLFILRLTRMNEEQVRKYLKLLEMDDFFNIFCNKRPKFEINSENEQILSIFKEKKWISSFYVDKVDSRYYRAFGYKSDKLRKGL